MGTPVSMQVSHGGIERIQSTSAVLIYRAEYSSVFPVTVEEKDVLQIRGWGFAAHEQQFLDTHAPTSRVFDVQLLFTLLNAYVIATSSKNINVIALTGFPPYNGINLKKKHLQKCLELHQNQLNGKHC